MRIVLFANNRVGCEVLQWLVGQGEQVVGLVLHPDDTAAFKTHMQTLAQSRQIPTWEPDSSQDEEFQAQIAALQPDLLLSVSYGYRLPTALLELPGCGAINLHNGYLPFNRGTYANVWSIVDDTPAGATLHFMEAAFDSGDIIDRIEVQKTLDDTGASLHRKIEKASMELFISSWPKIKTGDFQAQPQFSHEGSYHLKKDVALIDEIDLNKMVRARDLINLLRARTFVPHESAYCIEDGVKYYIRVSIEKEEK
ncbi:MAG: formyltransferase family protein [Chromatiales bacterium]|jgi:methionyl-tRNA formyltransferase